MSERDGEQVELLDCETVAGRGLRRITWFVRRGDGWQQAACSPAVRREPVEAGPGTVWQSRLWLTLPRGTWLMRVESAPREAPRRSVLDHLEQGAPAAAQRIARSFFRVGRTGRLLRQPRPAPATPARSA